MLQLAAQDLIASAFNLGLLSERIVKLSHGARETSAPTIIYDRVHMHTAIADIMNISGLANELSMPATHSMATRCALLIAQLTTLDSARSAGSIDLSEQIGFMLQQLSTTFADELRSIYFVSIETAYKEYLDDDISVFGEEVDKKFPKALEDISEAAKCLAFGRSTACVFHLMRVMEHCIQRLGKKLKVKADIHRDTWYKIGTDVNNAINAMPGQTAKQAAKKQKYGLAYSNLNGVRMAWRNDVMHPKATYTEEEARNIFSHVGAFLKSLSPLV